MLMPKGFYTASANGTPGYDKNTNGKVYAYAPILITMDNGEEVKRSFRGYVTTPGNRAITYRQLQVMGCLFRKDNPDDFEGFGSSTFRVRIDHREGSDGKTYDEIVGVYENGGGRGGKKASSAAKDSDENFLDDLRASLAALRGGDTDPKTPAAPAGRNGDVPF